MAATVYDYNATTASNTSFDGISYDNNQLTHGNIDNLFRAVNGATARFVDDLGAVNTVGGTGDAITVTLASAFTALATGQVFRFIAGAANTTAVTINVNSIGAKAIRKIVGGTDVALVANDILAGVRYELIYDAAANSAAGAWILLNLRSPVPVFAGAGSSAESGKALEWTSIPASARRIVISCSALSLSGTDNFLIQIGDSGGFETADYGGFGIKIGSSVQTAGGASDGMPIIAADASQRWSGHIMLDQVASGEWIMSANMGELVTTGLIGISSATKTLTGTLDRVRIISSGTDTIDNGSAKLTHWS